MTIDFLTCLTLHLLLFLYSLYVAAAVPAPSNPLSERIRRAATGTCDVRACLFDCCPSVSPCTHCTCNWCVVEMHITACSVIPAVKVHAWDSRHLCVHAECIHECQHIAPTPHMPSRIPPCPVPGACTPPLGADVPGVTVTAL